MNNCYYVYVYLDLNKPGKYEYSGYTFEHEPFYIGKGQGTRHLAHLKEAENISGKKGNNLKLYRIRKCNKNIKIIKILEQCSNDQASTLEIELITSIGRIDLKTGPLTNLTNGGEGSSGWICSEETKEKISRSNKFKKPWNKDLRKETDARVAKQSKYQLSHPREYSDETRKKMSLSAKKRCVPGAEWSHGLINPSHDPKMKEKMIKTRIERGSQRGEKNGRWKSVDEQEITRLYVTENLSMGEIAKRMNIHYKIVRSRLHKNNVKIIKGSKKCQHTD